MLTAKKKANIIKKTQIHDTDTGSPEVQIGILSRKIDDLAGHLKTNKKDNHSRRGLMKMIADRRKHLKYLSKTDAKRYNKLVKDLAL
jgi:small subunit ribosomal protein S15